MNRTSMTDADAWYCVGRIAQYLDATYSKTLHAKLAAIVQGDEPSDENAERILDSVVAAKAAKFVRGVR